jgi:predicted nucleic acid-binding protein
VSERIGVDTSVAIPLLVATHAAHAAVEAWRAGRGLSLCGHALIETYAVLTRLPGDIRLSGPDAARLIAARFGPPLLLKPATTRTLPATLAGLGIAGGAVYDGIVALAAKQNDATLATRDARAHDTYRAVGASVVIVG